MGGCRDNFTILGGVGRQNVLELYKGPLEWQPTFPELLIARDIILAGEGVMNATTKIAAFRKFSVALVIPSPLEPKGIEAKTKGMIFIFKYIYQFSPSVFLIWGNFL